MIEVLSDPPGLLPGPTIDKIAAAVTSVAGDLSNSSSMEFGVVTVVIVPEHRICELHDQYFGDPAPTDVITFPGSETDEASPIDGDIVICLDVAREQAAEAGHPEVKEIVFLGVHGLLHLTGWDDKDPEDRERMLERQAELMRRAGQALGTE